jgi:hypothetical protein
VKENRINKSTLAQQEIISELGEKLYAGIPVKGVEVQELIAAKQLYYGVSLPYSSKEMLLIVSNEFSRNRYIPLDKRDQLSTTIRGVLGELKEEAVQEPERNFAHIWPWITGFLLVVVAVIGFISILAKFRRDAEVSIELDEENNPFDESSIGFRGYEYSQLVREVLNELGIPVENELKVTPQQPVYGPEFKVKTNKGEFLIETKAYRQKVGVNTIRAFLHMVRTSGQKGVLVATSSLTARAREMVQSHKQRFGGDSVSVVVGVTKGDITSSLRGVLV